LRLRGKVTPIDHSDLYVRVRLVLPEPLSDRDCKPAVTPPGTAREGI
jgi:hypothetical protein